MKLKIGISFLLFIFFSEDLPNGKAGCYHHIKVFSSSTSEDKTSEAGTAEVVELTEQQMNENEFTNHSTVMPSTKSNVNQINNLEIRNEPRKQRRVNSRTYEAKVFFGQRNF